MDNCGSANREQLDVFNSVALFSQDVPRGRGCHPDGQGNQGAMSRSRYIKASRKPPLTGGDGNQDRQSRVVTGCLDSSAPHFIPGKLWCQMTLANMGDS